MSFYKRLITYDTRKEFLKRDDIQNKSPDKINDFSFAIRDISNQKWLEGVL